VSDKPIIIVGLVIAVGALTFPFWYNLAIGSPTPSPDLETPEGQCVEDVETMRAEHMDLLNKWRDAVVRDGEKTYVSKTYGDSHEMSLTRTCMSCHESRESFCQKCHSYANVEPTCWDCHVESMENQP
jgi:hypothetical protein